MATSETKTNNDTKSSHDDLAITLDYPKFSGLGHYDLYQYQGFWCFAKVIESIKDFQQNFKASETDLVIASTPKSGTIWLKALAFAIVNRFRYPCSSVSKNYHHHPLLTVSPHDLVPFVEFKHDTLDNDHLRFTKNNPTHDSPCRLIATHIFYPSLPESIKTGTTKCKVIYLCRNPRDIFVSLWLFINELRAQLPESNDYHPSLSIEEAFEFFCNGVSVFGPFWDHVLGYWKESLENPHKVLFMKYEDLKKERKTQLKRLAEFIGCSFTLEEERQGVIEDVSSLCSFEHLKNLDVNKNGSRKRTVNKAYFRKGEIGDWENHLTPQMVKRLDSLMEEKLQGSGLVFQH
ncbi:hypothetical protein C5167_000184 [Papaver somniferum]|uniref:Sulfotransferase n=1 Tax=Papaver somniferum TaxID=3469 RepID=A0A4Y7KSK1_PAPSO|nr:cytosolic sulfotransferase 6-like [Papaver somniferum]RZC75787.1 hypothetical protein C5167_000184 [Papaver somniferum]